MGQMGSLWDLAGHNSIKDSGPDTSR
jgi:hypothetical protein